MSKQNCQSTRVKLKFKGNFVGTHIQELNFPTRNVQIHPVGTLIQELNFPTRNVQIHPVGTLIQELNFPTRNERTRKLLSEFDKKDN